MKHIISLLVTAVVGLILLYISRFWIFPLWTRNSFLADFLHPAGGMLGRGLRQWGGGNWAAFELLGWVVVFFLALTALEILYDRYFATLFDADTKGD